MTTKLTLDIVKSIINTSADGTVTAAALAAATGVNLQTASRFLTAATEEGTMYVAGTVKTGKRGRPASRFAVALERTQPVEVPVLAEAVAG